MIDISVIIPIYNMEDEIESCVHSVLVQEGNYEVILVDDGSVDGTYEKCIELQKEDNRIRILHTKNQGAGKARNEGIKCSRGKYLYFPDADDILETNALLTMYEEIEKNKGDLLVFGYKTIRKNGTLYMEKKYERVVFDGNEVRNDYSEFFTMVSRYSIQGAPWNKLFSAEVIKENNILFPDMRRHQDEGFIGRYMNCASKICFIPNVLYTYRMNDLKDEWRKYPSNYIDIVNDLYAERGKNILIWNANDKKTHELVEKERFCNIIRALEFSFATNKRMNLSRRYMWIKKQIKLNKMEEFKAKYLLGIYHRIIYFLIRKGVFIGVYFILLIKVIMNRTGVLFALKRLKK